MLLRQGAAVPVLVHLKTEGRDKVAAMWMPAMQAVGVTAVDRIKMIYFFTRFTNIMIMI